MDRIAIAKTLLKYIGRDSIENDWAIAQGVIVILDSIETEPKPEPAPSMKRETKPVQKKTDAESKRKRFDTGKLGALRKAGWSVIKIADEMGVSEQTVRNHMKKEGIA